MDAFDDACRTMIYSNESSYSYDVHGKRVPPAIVSPAYCPRQCSLQGSCMNGVCHCGIGFAGLDCSYVLNSALAIQRIRG